MRPLAGRVNPVRTCPGELGRHAANAADRAHVSLGKMVGPNDGTRTLIESILSREVIAALDDWLQTGIGGVLIGALGLSFCSKNLASRIRSSCWC